MERLGYRSFDRACFRHYVAWLTAIAQNIRRAVPLVKMLLEELRRHRILNPTRRMLELLVHQARSRAERLLYRALTNGLMEFLHIPAKRFTPGFRVDSRMILYHFSVYGLTTPTRRRSTRRRMILR